MSQDQPGPLATEADVLCQYLFRRNASAKVVELYSEIVRQHSPLTPTLSKAWARLLEMPYLLILVDSGLALTAPQHPFRARIYAASCAAEVDPAWSDFFLGPPAARHTENSPSRKDSTLRAALSLAFHLAEGALFGALGLMFVILSSRTLRVPRNATMPSKSA
jgi:hypothetical protein